MLKSLPGRVLVLPDNPKDATEGGIILPDIAKRRTDRGVVVSTPDDPENPDQTDPKCPVKQGDRVLFNAWETGDIDKDNLAEDEGDKDIVAVKYEGLLARIE